MGAMPLYEYECEGCKSVQEVRQKVSDPLLTQCPACGSDKVRKIVSRTTFALKGTGWYNTDYRKSTSVSSPIKSERETKSNTSIAEKTPKPDKT